MTPPRVPKPALTDCLPDGATSARFAEGYNPPQGFWRRQPLASETTRWISTAEPGKAGEQQARHDEASTQAQFL